MPQPPNSVQRISCDRVRCLSKEFATWSETAPRRGTAKCPNFREFLGKTRPCGRAAPRVLERARKSRAPRRFSSCSHATNGRPVGIRFTLTVRVDWSLKEWRDRGREASGRWNYAGKMVG